MFGFGDFCFLFSEFVWLPFFLWLFSFFLVLSVADCLCFINTCGNPLQRPIPAPPWEISCGLALPLKPPWQDHRNARKYHHYALLQRESRQMCSVRKWKRLIAQKALDDLPWLDENPEISFQSYRFERSEVTEFLDRLDPLSHYQVLKSLSSDSMLLTVCEQKKKEAALVAAADLRATYKAADLSWSPPVVSKQFVLHTVEDSRVPVVIDTGASVSLTPNFKDFIGPVSPPDLKSLQGLGSSSSVQGQGIVEWQIRDVLGTVRTIRTKAYLVQNAPVRLFSPQTYFKEGGAGNLYVDHQRAELTLHDDSILTFPFAENNLPYMLPDWQPIVGFTFSDQSILSNQSLVQLSVADETNQNLTPRQKELLKWHWKLGHAHFGWIQRLSSNSKNRRRILDSKHPISSAATPYCAACSLSKLKRRTPPGPHWRKITPGNEDPFRGFAAR